MARGNSGPATYDVVVVGAGAFGAWTAYALRKMGQRVCLIDAFGPANSLASSGDETRVTRCSYGQQEIYSRWARESLVEWKSLQLRNATQLFENTGVLAIAASKDPYLDESARALGSLGIPHERVNAGWISGHWGGVKAGHC